MDLLIMQFFRLSFISKYAESRGLGKGSSDSKLK